MNKLWAGWVAYLRNPRRKKTVARLVNPDNPSAKCCMGHLMCFLGYRSSHGAYATDSFVAEEVLPQVVCKRMDITPLGEFKEVILLHGKTYYSLGDVNDSYDYNFSPAEIADIIVEQHAAGNFQPKDWVREYR